MKPPSSVGLALRISIFHPLASACFLYIWNRLPANSAASSPPVPARISITQRVRLASSPPIVRSSSSCQIASPFRLQLGQLGFGQFAHFRIVTFGQLAGVFDFVRELLEATVLPRQPGQAAVFARGGGHPGRIGQNLGVGQASLQLFKASERLFQHFSHVAFRDSQAVVGARGAPTRSADEGGKRFQSGSGGET